jgi:hypothetical protein
METYMNNEKEPAMTPGPYAALSSMATPPDEWLVSEYLM